MFKSPVNKTPSTASGFNFIRNNIGPRQVKPNHISSAKILSASDLESNDHVLKPDGSSTIMLDLLEEGLSEPRRLAYTYQADTNIENLIDFVKQETHITRLNFKTKNVNLDYLLTLKHRKVKELNIRKLSLMLERVKIQNTTNYLRNFQILRCIGTGGFSKVYLARGYGQIMALKVIDKNFIIQHEKKHIVDNERQILAACSDHPFITKLFLAFETKHYLVFGMEYCNGGELFNLLRKVRRMQEQQAKFYFLQTFSAIAYLHANQILYRDLKPENIILDDAGHIRLADYGLSKFMSSDRTYSFCGSAEYMAPQMLLKKGHSYEIDYYCLGALLYELVIGLPPHYSRDQSQLFSNIVHNELRFPSTLALSNDLKSFLSRLLEKNANSRFKTTKEILQHPWLHGLQMDKVLQKQMQPPFKTKMFQDNYDPTDFASQQQQQLDNLRRQKQDRAQFTPAFNNFEYEGKEIIEIKQQLIKPKLDFNKNKQAKRSGSLKSLEDIKQSIEHVHARIDTCTQLLTDDSDARGSFISRMSQDNCFKLLDDSMKLQLNSQIRQNSRQNSVNQIKIHKGSYINSEKSASMKTLEGSSKIISMEPKIIGLGGKQIVTAGKVQTEERINATDGRISIEGKPMNNQIRSSLRLDEKVSRPSNKQMMQDRSGRSTVSKNSDSFKSHKQIGSINNGSEKNLNRWQVPVQTKRSEIQSPRNSLMTPNNNIPKGNPTNIYTSKQIQNTLLNKIVYPQSSHQMGNNNSNPTYYNNHKRSTERSGDRTKFTSLQHGSLGPVASPQHLRNNIYLQNAISSPQGGYLSNFKERMNPQKMKKWYRHSEKVNFNASNSSSSFKH